MFPAAFWETGFDPDAQPLNSAKSNARNMKGQDFMTFASFNIQ
jgi:hypothetical protein